MSSTSRRHELNFGDGAYGRAQTASGCEQLTMGSSSPRGQSRGLSRWGHARRELGRQLYRVVERNPLLRAAASPAESVAGPMSRTDGSGEARLGNGRVVVGAGLA